MAKYNNWSAFGREDALAWTHDHASLKLTVTVRGEAQRKSTAGQKKALVKLEDPEPLGGDNIWTKHFDSKGGAEEFARDWLKNHPYPDDFKVYVDEQYAYRARVIETDRSDVNDDWMARIELLEDLPADGVDAGEETWIDVDDIDVAMDLKPYERRQVRQFAKREDWIE